MAKSIWPAMSATLMPVSINRAVIEVVTVVKTIVQRNGSTGKNKSYYLSIISWQHSLHLLN
jgi:hypothetical protein